MATVRELLRRAESLSGDSPRRDGEVLLSHCLRRDRAWLYAWPDFVPDAGVSARFERLLAERRRGVPVAYLTGHREFWSLDLAVNPHTLIPRPETETLVQWALELDLPAAARVLDLGTGSGAIALALASERPGWNITGVDICESALAVARENGRREGLAPVRFLHSDWFGAVRGERFHLVVSNPPYVAAGDRHLCEGDLRFEPISALVAGDDGLADLTTIIRDAADHLLPGGWLLLEHGLDQGAAVREMLRCAGFAGPFTRQDLGGRDRATGGKRDAE